MLNQALVKLLEKIDSKIDNTSGKIRKKLTILRYLVNSDIDSNWEHINQIISVLYYRMRSLRDILKWKVNLSEDEDSQYHRIYLKELEDTLYLAKDDTKIDVYSKHIKEAVTWLGNAIKRWLGE